MPSPQPSRGDGVGGRLLYLGFAFPPGLAALHPGVNPAGHAFETQMVTALREHFAIRSVGTLPFAPGIEPLNADPASGLRHELALLERSPALLHRYQSLWRLIRQYLIWQEAGWAPDVVLVYNLAPIYNYFIRWLHRQANRPVLVLLLLDSPQLGRPLPWLKRLRYHFKPLVVPDAEMLDQFDGCIGLSPTVAEYFRPLGVPFLWMPGGCAPDRATTLPPPAAVPDPAEPIRFGYFGALASHAGVGELVKTFLGSSLSNSLRVCGYGKLSEQLAEQARRDQRLRFHGLLPSAADCLRFGQSCDVLINPRPPIPGNENTFPSKVFEYGLCGRAILSAQLSGVPVVLGEDGFYFDERDFERSLAAALAQVAALPRSVLHERGRRLRERLLRQYSWEAQAVRMARFLRECSQRQGALSRQPPARP